MSKSSSEDILLMIGNVRHKKVDGTLYLMTERVGWMVNSKNTFNISISYSDIKLQKISPDTKVKVQLQIIQNDTVAHTFQFTNSGGREAQVGDRDNVREFIQQILPKFKKGLSKELEEKNRILQEDPELFQLYKDLVITEIVSSEEFWANHAQRRREDRLLVHGQETGVSVSFLAEVKPQTDGVNGIKYNITADTIESIFKTYPAVRRKHLDCVPDRMSESEFWTRFFQSHYFHRDRINAANSKDLFAECVRMDEQDMCNELKKVESDPLCDLQSINDRAVPTNEGFGSAVPDQSQPSTSSGSSANQNLIRRFNQHSMMILRTCSSDAPSTKTVEDENKILEMTSSKKRNGIVVNGAVAMSPPRIEPANKRAKLIEKTLLNDLSADHTSQTVPLNVDLKNRYLTGPILNSSQNDNGYHDSTGVVGCQRTEVRNWSPFLPGGLTPGTAIAVLGELSPGGALMKTGVACKDGGKPFEITKIDAEFKSLYNAGSELLRHFWLCFPANSQHQEDKLKRMYEALRRFESSKVIPFMSVLNAKHLSVDGVKHLRTMLETAYAKYQAWLTRKRPAVNK